MSAATAAKPHPLAAVATLAASGDPAALASLIAGIRGLVVQMAVRGLVSWGDRFALEDRDDIIADAFAAVIENVENYDPARGAPTTYFANVARGATSTSARLRAGHGIHIPLYRFDSTSREGSERNDGDDCVRRALASPVRLGAPAPGASEDDGDGFDVADPRGGDHTGQSHRHEKEDAAALVARVLKAMSPLAARVLRLRYGLDDAGTAQGSPPQPRTLEEIGREIGRDRETTRRIEAKALKAARWVLADGHSPEVEVRRRRRARVEVAPDCGS